MELSEQIAQQFINGVSLGSIYALIALGYTMVYGIIKLINFAHGDIYMVGAYLGFFAVTNLGLPIVPALILAMVVTGLLGIVIEKLAYKPLRHAPRISALISAIGVSLFLEYAMMYFVSPTPLSRHQRAADAHLGHHLLPHGRPDLHRAVHEDRQGNARRVL